MRLLTGLCALVLANALALSSPLPGLARSYTTDDLLQTEALGRAQIDPSGRWAVVERQRPWREISDYSYGGLTPTMLSELWVADLKGRGPLERLLPSAPDTGYLAGPMSPDGSQLLVYRLRGDRLSAGLANLGDHRIVWTDESPQLPVFGRVAQWTRRGEVLMLTTGEGRLPYHLASRRTVQDRLPGLWRQAAAGRSSTRSAVGSGRFLPIRPRTAPGALVAVDARSGAAQHLVSGEFIDLEISPSGRWAALIERAGDIQPSAEEAARIASPTRVLRLVLIDLTSGRLSRPDLPTPLAPGLLSWSKDERLLVALATTTAARQLAVAHARTGRVELLAPAPLALTRNLEGSVYPRAEWRGDRPFAEMTGADGALFWRDVAHPDALPAANDGGGWTSAIPPEPGTRLTKNPPMRPKVLRQAGEVKSIAANGQILARWTLPPGAEVLAAGGDQLLARTTDAHGVTRLLRLGADGPSQLAALNDHLAQVEPARIAPVRHAGPDGEPLTSWLYLPASGAPRGLVVIPYRGAVYPTPPALYAPGAINTYRNAQILVGAGYAVLAPSLPYDAARTGPAQGIAADILRAVDAATDQAGLQHLPIALYGHSFGALGAVAAASQSDRFASVIAAAGVQDEAASWGEFMLHNWVAPEDGLSSQFSAGKVETGQAGLEVPPWAAPERYRAASNIYAADRITAPVLLIHGDLDEIRATQSQALFTALYRQRKDAMLVTYWGEGHTFASAANIADLYASILDWLDLTLAPPSPSAAPTPPP